MRHFCMLSSEYQMTLILLVFAELLCNLILLVYKGSHLLPLRKLILKSATVLVLLVLLFLLTQGSQKSKWLFHIPVWALILILFLMIFCAAADYFHERKRFKRELSPLSIQQAMDDLPLGICFADPSGTLVFCNKTMSSLGTVLIGSFPQTYKELQTALQSPPVQSRVRSLENTESSYFFPDGTIWSFKSNDLTSKGLEGFSQITAQNITDLYQENKALEEVNCHLEEVMEKLKRMYERMSEMIREKESLELKVYIHDTLGRSLLTIRDIMDSSSENVEKKMDMLKEAISYLTSNYPVSYNTMEEVEQKALELGVKVKREGYVPSDTQMEKLTASAVRECVTNCVRHAHGNEVYVRITENAGIRKVLITNNGELPKGKIMEGSGLSTLRKSVEAFGGEMYLSHNPAFALILYFPGEEMNEI